jgi:glycosyltransferase involved in cell wall biosynthesis
MPVLQSRVLVFVHHTIGIRTRSGIQRVVVELCRSLQGRVEVDFVKWDATDGQLRYVDIRDIDGLFHGERHAQYVVNPNCHRVNYRFSDTISSPENTWLIFPEIPYFMPRGNEIFSRIISQCKNYRIRVAAIFYDLIPIRYEDYATTRSEHIEYATELVRCDKILGISKFSADDLRLFYKACENYSKHDLELFQDKIGSVLLGEYREGASWGIGQGQPIDTSLSRSIVLLGTVEPRKQQTRFLRIFNDLLDTEPLLGRYSVEIIGSLHPLSASAFHKELARNSQIHYHQYSSDEFIDRTMGAAEFSVFLSHAEGYGLPIVESLRHGVPCLTTSFGPMAEIGSLGGCLMTDALSDDAIEHALLLIVRDSDLRKRLRSEIAARVQRSWGNYANDLLGCLFGEPSASRTALQDTLEQLRGASVKLEDTPCVEINVRGVDWLVSRVSSGQQRVNVPDREPDYARKLSAVIVNASTSELVNAEDSMLRWIAEADMLCFKNPQQELEFVRTMRARGVDRLLPEYRHVCDEAGIATAAVAQTILSIGEDKAGVAERGRQERLFARISSQVNYDLPKSAFDLAIVVSTYNRAPFTELNVDWLVSITKGLESKVCIVVVDNASTDDTLARLDRFRSIANLTIRTNSANVGMLGNLHVTSTLSLARHVWTIGDDDFIRRDAILRVLQVIQSHPRVPLIAHNFAVYHRPRLAEGDSPIRFEMEATPLCRTPSPSGLMPIRRFAEEHDNLFTAIYPLVFRSDLAAACFNYPFDGIPFGNLIESVPTTKIILETLADCEGYWLSEIGITGNAHNSWSGHRPRWHLVIMPQIFYLARKRGIDPQKLWAWTKVHLNLFYESLEVALKTNKPIHLSESEIQEAEWIFQQKIELPVELGVYAVPPAPLWKFMNTGPRNHQKVP